VTTRRSLTLEDPLLLSDSLSHLGDLLTRRAQLDAAEQVYREAIRLESSRPKDPAARVQLRQLAVRFRCVPGVSYL
jgi:hypothetical protein